MSSSTSLTEDAAMRVDALRTAIAEGRYVVDCRAVAEALVAQLSARAR